MSVIPRAETNVLKKDRLLAQIVERLVVAFQPERIYLFGSHARGEATPDSDYDLLVVVPDDAPPECCRRRRAYESLWGLSRAGDVLVTRHGQFERRRHLVASLPGTVLREGKLIYAT